MMLISNDNLDFKIGNEKINISQLPIKDVQIEEIIGCTGKIADVLIYFEDFYKNLGRGIVIEIQLSSQSRKTTSERTHDRVKDGFSIWWLFNKDINNFNKIEST